MDTDTRSALYPASEPFTEGRLAVSDGHELYYRQYGNPAGKVVLILHGGPGAGAGPNSPRFFDPNAYRIVVFDQRGCGRSTPHAELTANTTWHLVADIERLRVHLAIERWLLFGGSWGATLALIYAETHPDRVTALILRGVFTFTQREIDWFYKAGANALLPEAFEAFRDYIPAAERDDLIGAYYRRLTDLDPQVQRTAAQRWAAWETAASTLGYRVGNPPANDFVLAFARIECHYFIQGGFLPRDDWILAHVDRLHNIPAVLVNGRLDLVTPVRNAWALQRAWPQAELQIGTDAGHSAFDTSNMRALMQATERFKPRC